MSQDDTSQQPETRDDAQDAPSPAHTELGGEHPAGDGPRTDRDVGGPTPEPDESSGDRPAE